MNQFQTNFESITRLAQCLVCGDNWLSCQSEFACRARYRFDFRRLKSLHPPKGTLSISGYDSFAVSPYANFGMRGTKNWGNHLKKWNFRMLQNWGIPLTTFTLGDCTQQYEYFLQLLWKAHMISTKNKNVDRDFQPRCWLGGYQNQLPSPGMLKISRSVTPKMLFLGGCKIDDSGWRLLRVYPPMLSHGMQIPIGRLPRFEFSFTLMRFNNETSILHKNWQLIEPP